MKAPRQMLVLDDLGLPHSSFEARAKAEALPFQILWDGGTLAPDPERVEILVTIKKRVDGKLLQGFPNLRMVAVAFTGFDSVDLEACRERGIAVYNVPTYATHSVVELVLGLTFALLRNIPLADQVVRQGEWALAPGQELHGRKVGILGTGRTGLATARIFKALGCELLGWSRRESDEFKALGGTYLRDREEFFAKADLVSLHLALNEDTRGFVDREAFAAMRPTAYLINTARGPILDEGALIWALQNGKIAGAGLDVFDSEPLGGDSPLLSMENVVLTPHIAYRTVAALQRRMWVTVGNIKAFLEDDPANRVD